MRQLLIAAFAAAAGLPAAAQTTVVPAAPRLYDAAPWWMREPIVPVVGNVRTELPANRANFSASFTAVEKTVAEATRTAGEKVLGLGEVLRGFGADKVRVGTTFSIRPIYEQYRDKDGRLIENRQPDQIERYEASANVQIEVRDTALTERVYAAVLAARPSSTGGVGFRLEPDNAARTELYGLAVADAARRAKLSVEGTGGRLGAVKLVDPSGRACETDVLLAGAPRGQDNPQLQEVVLTASRAEAARGIPVPPPLASPAAPPPPPPPAAFVEPSVRLPLQVPLQQMTARVCVIYALTGG
jgi:uncharacterized protein YggE